MTPLLRKILVLLGGVALCTTGGIGFLLHRQSIDDEEDDLHFRNEETQVLIANVSGAEISLYRAGGSIASATPVAAGGLSFWLPKGRYFIQASRGGSSLYYPLQLSGYHSGPDENGAFTVTIRQVPREHPPRLFPMLPAFAFVPSGWFAFGDRQNPTERHHVWLGGFFIAPFEVTNREFASFLNDSDGYANAVNWSEEGLRWKQENKTASTAGMSVRHPEYRRFGADALPVTWVNWYEASAYCIWLTRRIGGGVWLFRLPTEEEWEKVARGPDTFDYGLSMSVSDAEFNLYNWHKNPDAETPLMDQAHTLQAYRPNRYGVYHMSGNVTEWTDSRSAYSVGSRAGSAAAKEKLGRESGRVVIRGGSWYSASTATLYIPFRDSFQPEHSTQEVGFRIIARRLP
jgi:formylglycine-generating enzyme required for sulfatase activity